MTRIHIVYYAYIIPPRWHIILTGQMDDIVASGIDANMTIVLCGESSLLEQAVKLVHGKLDVKFTYEIRQSTQNEFEYPGISALHSLSLELSPETLFIYLHSKGMVYHVQPGRNPTEQILTQDILDWSKYLRLFEEDSTIQKAGLFPTLYGAMWYNFYWVRGSYLKTKSPPIKSTKRYYFEHWLGKKEHSHEILMEDDDDALSEDCYGTYHARTGHVPQNQVIRLMHDLLQRNT